MIRIAKQTDLEELINLFRETVLSINRRDYQQNEVEDWALCGDDLSKWKLLIDANYFVVAENSESKIVGFSSITPQGYLHSMFVHKDFQNKGIATSLLTDIEEYAKINEIALITSEVSLTARSFFERHGYTVNSEQKKVANKLSLTNFKMSKELN